MKREQLGVKKHYTMPYSWSWACSYCKAKNQGDSVTCGECGSQLWEEEATLLAEEST